MTCKRCGQVVKLTRTMNKCHLNTELSSHEGTRCEFNRGKAVIKLGIDVHQEFYVVAMQEGGSNPKPAQRFSKGSVCALGGQAQAEAAEARDSRGLRSVRVWFWLATQTQRSGDQLSTWFVRKNSMSTTSGSRPTRRTPKRCA